MSMIRNQTVGTPQLLLPRYESMTQNDYTSQQITVLEGLAPVRKRPAMYIGSTDTRGLHHCLWEIIDNSNDEALAGYGKNVWILIHKDGHVSVADDGRGIPVDIMPQYGKSALEIVMTKLHAGGKFDAGAYKVSGGLHGVGASCVNALSTNFEVEVRRAGKIHHQAYVKGKPKKAVQVVDETRIPFFSFLTKNSITGTTTTFSPDPTIFKEGVEFITKTIKANLKDRAYLTPGTHFHLFDQRTEDEYHYYFEGGIVSLIKNLNVHHEPFHEPVYIKAREGDVEVEVAIQYNDTVKEAIVSYVNIISTVDGGTHVSGFRSALTRVLKDYAQKNDMLKGGKNGVDDLTGDDTKEGLTAVISVKMPSAELQFEGQTKGKLGNSEIQPLVARIVKDGLTTYLEEHPKEARTILAKVILAVKARKAAKAAKDAIMRKGLFDSLGLPGKLADCQSKHPEESEIYLVEGQSAGGTAKEARDRRTQAILPLRGKVLNTEKARLDKIVEFAELKDLIIALGTGIGETLDPKKLRYHRIIIMCDADVDGAHITTLLLTFFFRHLPDVIAGGFLYLAQPPLYKLKQGKTIIYTYTEEEKEHVLQSGQIKQSQAFDLQRYKGLGEMNPIQLWETTMNPETRILKQVNIEDAQKADEVFTVLMGSEVPPRRRFIQSFGHKANIDV